MSLSLLHISQRILHSFSHLASTQPSYQKFPAHRNKINSSQISVKHTQRSCVHCSVGDGDSLVSRAELPTILRSRQARQPEEATYTSDTASRHMKCSQWVSPALPPPMQYRHPATRSVFPACRSGVTSILLTAFQM